MAAASDGTFLLVPVQRRIVDVPKASPPPNQTDQSKPHHFFQTTVVTQYLIYDEVRNLWSDRQGESAMRSELVHPFQTQGDAEAEVKRLTLIRSRPQWKPLANDEATG